MTGQDVSNIVKPWDGSINGLVEGETLQESAVFIGKFHGKSMVLVSIFPETNPLVLRLERY